MAREKATITLDREKATRAASLSGRRTISDVVDLALDRLIQSETLRNDVAAYRGRPTTAEEIAIAELPIEFDLSDDEVDYEALYGGEL